ncbi:MAG: CHAT domain-containing protein, partial [Nitrospinota bacterium]|nr:CHAT domain-containing protein [Nitrospinota bacterium]
VVVIEYLMARNEVVAFTLSRSGIDATRTPVDRAHLEKTLIQYRELIQKGAPVDELSASLHQILIEPVIEKIKEATVVGLVPHRGLHYLSFASMKDSAGYLIDKKPIFYLPSVSVYQWSMNRRQAGPKTVLSALALGNPDLGDVNTDLPLSELEAQSIKWSFPGARVLVGKQATESAAVKNAGDYRILHIASHGQFDPVAPLRSALMLAGGEQADGALTAGEVFSMRLDAEMVVMSACQTGLGKVTGGDEVVGLNRAFLYSGARAVLSTLWRVDDLASALLIKHFYRGYSSMEKAQALRAAQLAVKSRFGHPSYWAGFTLVGDHM